MAMMAYRSSWQESTGQTLYLMLFCREIDMPVDVVYGRPALEGSPVDTTAYVKQLPEMLKEAHEFARRSTEQSRPIQIFCVRSPREPTPLGRHRGAP